jgi:hypothetical protein
MQGGQAGDVDGKCGLEHPALAREDSDDGRLAHLGQEPIPRAEHGNLFGCPNAGRYRPGLAAGLG